MTKVLLLFIFCIGTAFADDSAYLDPAYKNLIIPMKDKDLSDDQIERSNLNSMLRILTPVRGQGSRGTCSIFSSLAMIEALLVRDRGLNPMQVDLSEEWVEFLSIASRNSTTDGSWDRYNWFMVQTYGVVDESSLPYIGETWTESIPGTLSEKRCGHLVGTTKHKVCLLAHWDPAYLNASIENLKLQTENPDAQLMANLKIEALNKRNFIFNSPWLLTAEYGHSSIYQIYGLSEAREYLNNTIPIILSLDFFYGAWQHGKAPELGLNRDLQAWNLGVVGVPVSGSLDFLESKKPANQAGHAVLVVGYDDEKVVTQNIKMQDGTIKKFTFKGVYYFKNSWGTTGFGKDFMYEGKRLSGFGMIPYEYANNYGSFFKLKR